MTTPSAPSRPATLRWRRVVRAVAVAAIALIALVDLVQQARAARHRLSQAVDAWSEGVERSLQRDAHEAEVGYLTRFLQGRRASGPPG